MINSMMHAEELQIDNVEFLSTGACEFMNDSYTKTWRNFYELATIFCYFVFSWIDRVGKKPPVKADLHGFNNLCL